MLNSEAAYERAFRSGVTGVMTDHPAMLRRFLDANPDIRAYMVAKYPPKEEGGRRRLGRAMSIAASESDWKKVILTNM